MLTPDGSCRPPPRAASEGPLPPGVGRPHSVAVDSAALTAPPPLRAPSLRRATASSHGPPPRAATVSSRAAAMRRWRVRLVRLCRNKAKGPLFTVFAMCCVLLSLSIVENWISARGTVSGEVTKHVTLSGHISWQCPRPRRPLVSTSHRHPSPSCVPPPPSCPATPREKSVKSDCHHGRHHYACRW